MHVTEEQRREAGCPGNRNVSVIVKWGTKPSNGRLAVSISQTATPNAQMSARFLTQRRAPAGKDPSLTRTIRDMLAGPRRRLASPLISLSKARR